MPGLSMATISRIELKSALMRVKLSGMSVSGCASRG